LLKFEGYDQNSTKNHVSSGLSGVSKLWKDQIDREIVDLIEPLKYLLRFSKEAQECVHRLQISEINLYALTLKYEKRRNTYNSSSDKDKAGSLLTKLQSVQY
jgi:hypothetical protein